MRYNHIKETVAMITASNAEYEQLKKIEARRKMIRQSNERLRMLDEIGKQRQIKL
jgi:hypothetical protein